MNKLSNLIVFLIIIITFSSCGSSKNSNGLETDNIQNESPFIQNHYKRAEQGSIDSLNTLGVAYYFGTNNTTINKEKGLKYLNEAAQKDNIYAIVTLGQIYADNGNYTKAIDNFKIGMKRGNGFAYLMMGRFYLSGNGLEKNIDLAIKHLKIADTLGYIDSNIKLGLAYEYKNKCSIAKVYYKNYLLLSNDEMKRDYSIKVALTVKNMMISKNLGNYKEAYIWANLSVLSKAINREKVYTLAADEKKDEKLIPDYNLDVLAEISSNVSEKEKKELAPEIIRLNYLIFQKHFDYFKKNKLDKSPSGVYFSGPKRISDISKYIVNSRYKHIKYIKDNTDKNDNIIQGAVALNQIEVANTFMLHGSVVPMFNVSIVHLNKAKLILEKKDGIENLNKKFVSRINNLNNFKLKILYNLYEYQVIKFNKRKAKKS